MKKVRQLFTRLATMFLAVMCVLGMGTPVFAEDFTSATIGSFTITGFDAGENVNVTVDAYQIITVNVDDDAFQPEFPMYMWATDIQSWMQTNYKDYIGEDGRVLDKFYNMEAAKQTEFLEKLTLAIKNNTSSGITLSPAKTVTATTGSAEFTDMAMGEYLVTANGGVKIYSPTTVKLVPVFNDQTNVWKLGNPEIGVGENNSNMKSQDPSITKAVTKPTDQTVSIGDTVTYTLTVDIPDYPTNALNPVLKVSDTLGSALTYGGDTTVTVKVGNDAITSENNYSFTSANNLAGKAFEIVFANSFVLAHGGETMTISYTATVAETASNANDVLKNTAILTYSSNPYAQELKTKDSSQNVYTYKTVINKVNSEGKSLAGAQFVLQKHNDSEALTSMYFKADTASSTFTYNSAVGSTSEDYTAILTVGNDGNLTIVGLDEGTYTLTEKIAPDGYVIPNGSITFTIANDETEGGSLANLGTDTKVTTTGDNKLYSTDSFKEDKGYSCSGDTLTIKVQNISEDEADFTLPSTGGMGTLIFTVGGLFVMAGAVVLAVVMYKKKNA